MSTKKKVVKPEPVEKKAFVEEVTKKEYRVCDVPVCRLSYDKKLRKVVRQFDVMTLWSQEDLANEPAKSDALVHKFIQDLKKEEWFTSDRECHEANYLEIEEELDMLRHDVDYRKACPCCVAKKLEKYRDAMRLIREVESDRYAMIKDGIQIPDVLPPGDAHGWELKDNKLSYKVGPKTRELTITEVSGGTPEASLKALSGVLSKLIGEEAKKQLPDAKSVKALPAAK